MIKRSTLPDIRDLDQLSDQEVVDLLNQEVGLEKRRQLVYENRIRKMKGGTYEAAMSIIFRHNQHHTKPRWGGKK